MDEMNGYNRERLRERESEVMIVIGSEWQKNAHNKAQNITENRTKGKTRNHFIEFLAEVQATLNNYAITGFSFSGSGPQRVWGVDTIQFERVKSRAKWKKNSFQIAALMPNGGEMP